MNASIRLVLFPFIPLLFGCINHTAPAPFNVVVRGPASSCTIEVEGRRVTSDELLAIARLEAKRRRRAAVTTDESPYRCIGSVVFTLQRAGFKGVGFLGGTAGQGRVGNVR